MQMLREGLTPGVEDGRDADRAAEAAGIAAEGEQRVGGRPEQERVDHAWIALRERVERMGQGEDHMKVRNRQELRVTGRDPARTGLRLTRGTVAIPTGVVANPRGATVVTRLPMPAQEGGAARRDRAQRQRLDPREAMRAAIRVAVSPHDVGEGEAEGRDRGRRLGGDRTHGAYREGVSSRSSRSNGDAGPICVCRVN